MSVHHWGQGERAEATELLCRRAAPVNGCVGRERLCSLEHLLSHSAQQGSGVLAEVDSWFPVGVTELEPVERYSKQEKDSLETCLRNLKILEEPHQHQLLWLPHVSLEVATSLLAATTWMGTGYWGKVYRITVASG